MARIDTLANFLTDVAAAIKNKTGKTDPITPANFDTEIESIQAGGDTSMEDGLIEGTLTEYSNDRVTTIKKNLFCNDTKITTVDFPNVTVLNSSCFEGCTVLKNVNIPKVEEIGSHSFYSCSNLTSFDFTNVKKIGQAAFRKTKITSIDAPVCTSTSSSGNTFEYMTSLVSVNLPELTYLNTYDFTNCTSLQTIILPKVTSIGYYAFQSCSSLTKADFPLLTRVQQGLFSSCTKLDTLILRNSVLCTLEKTNAISNTLIAQNTGYIYVPSALIEDYKVATNWTTYADQFRAIEDYPDICGEVTE